jgi:hypothetical protein
MMRQVIACVALTLGFVAAGAHGQQGMSGAFQDGMGLGTTEKSRSAAMVNSESASAAIPQYGANAPESGYFAGGDGNTISQGVVKLQQCASGGSGGTSMQQQECEAVNFLAKNPDIRPRFNIGKNDATIQAAKTIRKDAESAFQSLGVGQGSSTSCVQSTETIPAQYTTESCLQTKEVGESGCTYGRVVNIDGDSNFQCGQTVSAYETSKCKKTISAEITYNSSGSNVVATIRQGAQLQLRTGSSVLDAYIDGRITSVPSGTVFNAADIGLGSGRFYTTYSGCYVGSPRCSGTFNHQILRDNGTWWDIVAGSFTKDTTQSTTNPYSTRLGEAWSACHGWWGYADITINNNYISVSRNTATCGGASFAATLSPGQSMSVSYGSCPGSLTFYGNGQFSYSYWSHHDCSSDASGWKSTSFSQPVINKTVTIASTNNCALFEARAQ